MIKTIFLYVFVFLTLFFSCFFIHEKILEIQGVVLLYSLYKVYLFHVGFSLLVCINFKVFSSVDNIFPQLGFIYLATIFLKIVLFTAFFYTSIFPEENLSEMARISLLIPMIIFLLTEAFFVAKILNKKE